MSPQSMIIAVILISLAAYWRLALAALGLGALGLMVVGAFHILTMLGLA